MATRIFSHGIQKTENFTANGALIQWAAEGVTSTNFPILMTNLQAQFSRNINPITPINTDADGNSVKVNIIGMPSGVLQCDGLITNTSKSLQAFLLAVGESCANKGVRMTIRPFRANGCESDLKYTITGLTLQTFILQIQTAEVTIVRQPLSFVFTDMYIEP